MKSGTSSSWRTTRACGSVENKNWILSPSPRIATALSGEQNCNPICSMIRWSGDGIMIHDITTAAWQMSSSKGINLNILLHSRSCLKDEKQPTTFRPIDTLPVRKDELFCTQDCKRFHAIRNKPGCSRMRYSRSPKFDKET
jgi:hypothetical protein